MSRTDEAFFPVLGAAELASEQPQDKGGSRYADKDGDSRLGDELVWEEKYEDYEEDEDEEAEMGELPPHACSYCGIHLPGCVAKCLQCKKWFCNDRKGGMASHIVTHFVRSKHKGLATHPESALQGAPIECYSCQNRNIFVLGFIPAKGDNVFMMLCRSPCLITAAPKDGEWDVGGWQPIIEDRCIQSWLLSSVTKKERKRSRPITFQLMMKLEEAWRTNPTTTLVDLAKDIAESGEATQLTTKLRYSSVAEHLDIYKSLVALEMEYAHSVCALHAYEHVAVDIAQALHGRRAVSFVLPPSDDSFKAAVGEEISIECDRDDSKWTVIAVVTSRSNDGTIKAIGMPNREGLPAPGTEIGCTVRPVWRSTSFDRQNEALRMFANGRAMSKILYDRILGIKSRSGNAVGETPETEYVIEDVVFAGMHLKDEDLHVPGLPPLNASQIHAVRHVLCRPLSLIQGPPGTGKTVTSATIVYHLVQRHRCRVLVCAPSNVAVNHLAEKIAQTGLRVVRVLSFSRENTATSADRFMLHNLVRDLAERTNPTLKRLLQLNEEFRGQLSEADQKKLQTMIRTAELAILSHADVVCATCNAAGDVRHLARMNFPLVLIDEATQATEPECLIPLVRGAQQVILVGDHCQMGPVVLSTTAAKSGLRTSLFERLIMLGNIPVRLEVQYRMHPTLSLFPSNTFYDGSLQNGVSADDRRSTQIGLRWPKPNSPMYFQVITGKEEFSGAGTSYLNRGEAAAVEETLLALINGGCINGGVEPSSIGIITPYEGQRAYLAAILARNPDLKREAFAEIEIASVDAFQGREKDYILYTCVRSNPSSEIGFLHDPRRLNVALTRAKYGLILFGNPTTLARNALWHALLTHFQRRGLLVEGPVNQQRISSIRLPTPRRYIPTNVLQVATVIPQAGVKAKTVASDSQPLNSEAKQEASRSNSSFEGVTPQPAVDVASAQTNLVPDPITSGAQTKGEGGKGRKGKASPQQHQWAAAGTAAADNSSIKPQGGPHKPKNNPKKDPPGNQSPE